MAEENTHLTDPAPGREYPGMPRWVKVSGIIIIGLVLLVVVTLLAATALGLHTPSIGPGQHGPGGGTPSGDAGDQTPLTNVIEDQALSGGDLAGRILPSGVIGQGVQGP